MKEFITVTLITLTISVFAQNKYTFVFLNKKPDAENLEQSVLDKLMEGHMANINRLATEKSC